MKHISRMPLLVAAWLFCCAGVSTAGASQAAQEGPVISEFMAVNSRAPLDGDHDSSDWIEIYNAAAHAIDLDGWYLTDDLGRLEKWEFPPVTMAPGAYLVVFASGKDVREPGGELHTSFSLASEGESVALVQPDGKTIADAYVEYPPQLADISYGLSSNGTVSQTETVLVPEGADARALIPTNSSLGLSWTQVSFNDAGWLAGKTGVGYDYAGLIQLDVAAMRNVNQTVHIRIPFDVTDVTKIDKLLLRLKFEDGFVAYVNGVEVARNNAPEGASLTWNSGAPANRDDSLAVEAVEFDLTASKGTLVKGKNVLAIHGLNNGLTSSDLLILPQLVAVEVESIDLSQVMEGYLLQPTPGSGNQSALAQVGPVIRDVTEDPLPPAPGQDLVITARVSKTLAAIRSVNLVCGVNFVTESRFIPSTGFVMVDNGVAPDARVGDGIYTAAIPAQVYAAGDMVRWYVKAEDVNGKVSRNPLFALPNDSPEWYGTVVQDSAIHSSLPVVHWFVQNVGASESRSGTRGALYYNGEFYDNVVIHIRGGSTAGAPKKHFKVRFNHGYKFRYSDDSPRVNEINLNSPYSDKAYLRQNLAFEAYDWCGCPGSESFPVRAERNGDFYGVQILIEEPEEELLEREGMDSHGALYKMYNTFNVGGSAEKKTRRWEGRQDLDDFCRSINNTSGTTRHNNIFDRVDLPRTLDYLVATILEHQNDHPHKNHYLYRDSDGSGEWCFLPWDHDLTWGSNWIGDQGGSYGDVIYANDDQVPGRSTNVKPSHPFVGKQDCQEWNNHWNLLIDALLNDTTVRQMYLRRLRTVMDEFLKPPGTPASGLFIETRIDQLVSQMAQDVALDYRKWANPWTWGGQEGYPRDQSFSYAIDVLKNDYLAVRRTHLFVTHNADKVASYKIAGSYSAAIPNAQPANPSIKVASCDYNPASGNQDEEYIELKNPNTYTVDISDWELTGGATHTFLPGTVIAANGSLYVSPNSRAFRGRTASPKGGEGRFVQGNYKGHLSSWSETVNLLDRLGRLVDTFAYTGNPSDQQKSLRVTEIMYNPSEGGSYDNEQYEFIEIKNIGTASVKLDGVKFTRGISYTFEVGRNRTLAAGACIVIARNQSAFTSRYSGAVSLAPGTFTGSLDNAGEEIELQDRTNSTILEFEYNDTWYPTTDGQGYSLTIKSATSTDLTSWSRKDSWRASPAKNGSPGS
ncbi:MAG: lamin tail domain-containing protein [Sedimentisphaerales bacterium]|nr:lamin tail domain-containing protein [Sedimentisphaerales bacterium]